MRKINDGLASGQRWRKKYPERYRESARLTNRKRCRTTYGRYQTLKGSAKRNNLVLTIVY